MFYLDERIESTSFFLADWPLSRVLLKNDRNYPWFLLVPRREGVKEIYHLTSEDQIILMQEINRLSLLVNQYYQPKKLNIASLGNIVEQLHIHCVARTEHDPLWPQGIWQAAYVSEPYAEERIKTIVSEHQRLVSKL